MSKNETSKTIFICDNCNTLMWENELYIEEGEKKCCCCAGKVSEYIALPKDNVKESQVIDLTDSDNFLTKESKEVLKQIQDLFKEKITYVETVTNIKNLYDAAGEFEILTDRDRNIYEEVTKVLQKTS